MKLALKELRTGAVAVPGPPGTPRAADIVLKLSEHIEEPGKRCTCVGKAFYQSDCPCVQPVPFVEMSAPNKDPKMLAIFRGGSNGIYYHVVPRGADATRLQYHFKLGSSVEHEFGGDSVEWADTLSTKPFDIETVDDDSTKEEGDDSLGIVTLKVWANGPRGRQTRGVMMSVPKAEHEAAPGVPL